MQRRSNCRAGGLFRSAIRCCALPPRAARWRRVSSRPSCLARILTPERFSIFIVVGAIGYTLWLADLGFSNILFVNLRSAHLAGGKNEQAARQVTAVILFYAVLALAASLLCFTVALTRPAATHRRSVRAGVVPALHHAQSGLDVAAQHQHRGRRVRILRKARARSPRHHRRDDAGDARRPAAWRLPDRLQHSVGRAVRRRGGQARATRRLGAAPARRCRASCCRSSI